MKYFLSTCFLILTFCSNSQKFWVEITGQALQEGQLVTNNRDSLLVDVEIINRQNGSLLASIEVLEFRLSKIEFNDLVESVLNDNFSKRPFKYKISDDTITYDQLQYKVEFDSLEKVLQSTFIERYGEDFSPNLPEFNIGLISNLLGGVLQIFDIPDCNSEEKVPTYVKVPNEEKSVYAESIVICEKPNSVKRYVIPIMNVVREEFYKTMTKDIKETDEESKKLVAQLAQNLSMTWIEKYELDEAGNIETFEYKYTMDMLIKTYLTGIRITIVE